MIVSNEKEVLAVKTDMPGVKDAAMKALVGPEQGWEDHVMRVVEVGRDGFTPRHAHPWPHINYMLEGNGVLYLDGREHEVAPGAYAYIPAGKEHQFRNAGSGTFRFICIVPKEGHK